MKLTPEMTRLGNAHIAFGTALKNPRTKLSTLAKRAFDCGLRLTISIQVPKQPEDLDSEIDSDPVQAPQP